MLVVQSSHVVEPRSSTGPHTENCILDEVAENSRSGEIAQFTDRLAAWHTSGLIGDEEQRMLNRPNDIYRVIST